jgi:hypothetical protein
METGPSSIGPTTKMFPLSSYVLVYVPERNLVIETERTYTGDGITLTIYLIFQSRTAS